MVTLCRASNFPARSIEGYTINAGDLSIGHNWSEVYVNGCGWIPFDPTFDDGNGDSQNVTFNNLENVYVYMSFLRNDPNLEYYHYYYYNYSGDNIKVTKKITYNELI
jgi:transglutaminase-like putative cysteine protease